VIDPNVVTPHILLAGVVGAIVWNLITWWLGLPTSSSHALIGGFVGAGSWARAPRRCSCRA
jgi:PiT family inorganic phosphate transporter